MLTRIGGFSRLRLHLPDNRYTARLCGPCRRQIQPNYGAEKMQSFGRKSAVYSVPTVVSVDRTWCGAEASRFAKSITNLYDACAMESCKHNRRVRLERRSTFNYRPAPRRLIELAYKWQRILNAARSSPFVLKHSRPTDQGHAHLGQHGDSYRSRVYRFRHLAQSSRPQQRARGW
jgi:hypothetical protein